MFDNEISRMEKIIMDVELSISLYERKDLIVPKRLLQARNKYVSIMQQLMEKDND